MIWHGMEFAAASSAVVRHSARGVSGAQIVGLFWPPVGTAAVAPGSSQGFVFWALFYVAASAALVVFPFAAVPPLRRLALRVANRHRGPIAILLLLLLWLVIGCLAGAAALAGSNAHISMLFSGQAEAFFRDLIFPHGALNVGALAYGAIWAALPLVAMAKLGRRRHGLKGTPGRAAPYPARRKGVMLLAAMVFAVAVVAVLAARFQAAELAVRRDAALNEALSSKLRLAQNRSSGMAARGQSPAGLLAAAQSAERLAQASAESSARLQAATQRRNRRGFQLGAVVIALTAFSGIMAARRFNSFLRRSNGR